MRARYALTVLMCAATPAPAQRFVPPIMTLRVEQPAYTSLPIWLHVITSDSCLENAGAPASPGAFFNLYLWMRPDGPEVTRNGTKLSRTPFIDPTTATYHYFNNPHGPCGYGAPQTGEHDHRFALAGAYTFDQPGHYRVRWITKFGFGPREPGMTSDWFDFAVMASTPSQRDAWRAGLLKTLAGGVVSDDELIANTIPSLVTDWRNPNAADVLLDIACTYSLPVRNAATTALAWTLSGENARHFADLVKDKSCHLGEGNQARNFVERHAHEFAVVRPVLLRGLTRQLDKPEWQPYEAGTILDMMAAIRGPAAENGRNEGADESADETVLRLSPRIMAPHDAPGANSTQIDTGALVAYLSSHTPSLAEHDLLRKTANSPVDVLPGFDALMALHDPSDLPYLGTAIAGVSGMVWGNYITAIDTLVETYDRRTIPMLRTIALHANLYPYSLRASYHLLMFGDPAGVAAIDSVRNGYDWVAQRDAARTLNDLVAHHIALGTLAHYCQGTDATDPCNAASLKPSGACEPHLPCAVRRIDKP
jgi:hypothetical protein